LIKEIFTKHRQDFNEVRRLCLICHGLDLTTSSFSTTESRLQPTDQVETVLQNLVSSNLLGLAIAIRVNLYQGTITQPNIELPESAWLYFDKELVSMPATLKQVCDKIIHADSVTKPIIPSSMVGADTKITIQFKGVEFKKKAWTLNIVLERFAEDILNLLDEIESQKA